MTRRNVFHIFTGNANPKLAQDIATSLGMRLANAEVNKFPDGEIDVKVHEDVRGADCFIVQPTCPPVNENLMELFIILDALRRASAGRVTAVVPYYGYARKERKTQPREPISAKLIDAECHVIMMRSIYLRQAGARQALDTGEACMRGVLQAYR